MKVNVIGRCVVSGLGLLPVYNVEQSESDVRRLLNFSGVRVYDAETGLQITKTTFEPVVVRTRKPPLKPRSRFQKTTTAPKSPAVENIENQPDTIPEYTGPLSEYTSATTVEDLERWEKMATSSDETETEDVVVETEVTEETVEAETVTDEVVVDETPEETVQDDQPNQNNNNSRHGKHGKHKHNNRD